MGGQGNNPSFSDGSKPFGGFKPPQVKGRFLTSLYMAGVWFFIMYRMKQDGPHHFFHHHPWQEPEMIHYLDQVDKKYGTRYALDNMHHH